MADRRLPMRTLRRILKKFGVSEDESRGNGSHTLFFKKFEDGEFSFPLPYAKELAKSYVKNSRRAFRLTEADGVSDEDFYGAG